MKGKVFIGLMFLFIGIGIFFEQLGIWNFNHIISMWWPIILIIVGGMQLVSKPTSKTSGLILIIVGVLFQIKKLDIVDINLAKFFWPALLIVIGVSILVPKNDMNMKFTAKEINDDVIDNITIFSGLKAKNMSKNFKGGSLVAAFGGMDIDLRNANLSLDGARIDVTAAFGGVNLYVPPEWKVIIKGVPIFGGWSNKTITNINSSDGPVLKINCFVAFGGLEVRN